MLNKNETDIQHTKSYYNVHNPYTYLLKTLNICIQFIHQLYVFRSIFICIPILFESNFFTFTSL